MNKLKMLLGLFALLVFTGTAMAIDLDSAKSRGYVGEQQNGYLGLVDRNAPADAKQLLQDVNNQRRANYQSIARSNGVDLKSVESMGGQKAISKTAKGHYIQAANGQWVKK